MCHEKGILLESANLFSLSFIDDDLQNTDGPAGEGHLAAQSMYRRTLFHDGTRS